MVDGVEFVPKEPMSRESIDPHVPLDKELSASIAEHQNFCLFGE